MMWMKFNGKTFTNVLGIVGRDILPSITQTRISNPGENGERTISVKLENRELKVNMLIEPKENQTIRQAESETASAFYSGKNDEKMVFEDQPDVFWKGHLSKTALIKETQDFAECDLTFDCWPSCYECEETVYSNIDGKTFFNPGQSSTGSIMFSISDGRTSQVISLYGTTAKIKLYNATSLNGSWVIDMDARTASKDGVLSMDALEWENTNWIMPESKFEIPHGEFRFDFIPSVSAAEISYSRRFL